MCVTDPGRRLFVYLMKSGSSIVLMRSAFQINFVCVVDLCRKTSLRHSVFLTAMCALAPVCGLTTWTFALDTAPFNLYMMYLAYKFYQNADSQTSRKLFRYSLIYLPAVMILMFVSKNRTVRQSSANEDDEEQPAASTSAKSSEVSIGVQK